MQSRFSTAILLALCVAHGVLSIPLNLQPLQAGAVATAEETENYGRLDEAKNLANKNILKMQYVLNNPTQGNNQAMIDSAFGTDGSRNMQSIHNTVAALRTGNVPVALATSKAKGTVAFTSYDDSTNPMTPTHVEFAKPYHAKKTTTDTRAATLIHEATHYLADTGDYIKDGRVLRGSDPEMTNKNGYATGAEPKKSPGALDADSAWKKMRDGHKPVFGAEVPATQSLHRNAESFAQFSSMCGAAVSDRTVGLRRRAMANGNWEEAAQYLIKRQVCTIPKDYFAKKIAAKKAAEAKASGKSLDGGKTDKKALAGAKTLAGKKSLVAGKKSLLRGKTLSGKKTSTGAKSLLAGKKTLGRAKAPAAKKTLNRAKTLPGKKTLSRTKALSKSNIGGSKSLAKKTKTLAGAKGGVGSKAVGRKAKTSSVKTLSKGRVARPVSKVAGSRRPTSKASAGKRVTTNSGAAKAKTNSRTAAPAQHQAKLVQAAPRPKVAAAASLLKTVAKAAPKKVRRDLEFQL